MYLITLPKTKMHVYVVLKVVRNVLLQMEIYVKNVMMATLYLLINNNVCVILKIVPHATSKMVLYVLNA